MALVRLGAIYPVLTKIFQRSGGLAVRLESKTYHVQFDENGLFNDYRYT